MNTTKEHLSEIRADLMGTMLQDKEGPYWVTPYYDKATDTFPAREYNEIFNGNCGIALFFIALFEAYHQQEDLALAKKIIDRILKNDYIIQPRFYGFYTGITGLIYCLVRLYETANDEQYLKAALHLNDTHRNGISTDMKEMDLLSGAAGNLLVLTLLYHHTKEETVIEDIRILIHRFLNDARISTEGLKWDHSKLAYDSLTGFSHGASGIAYALMQVGTYFGYEGLIYLGSEALKYEMQYYDEQTSNWLDLRLGARRFNLPGGHTWELNVFLPELKSVNSWAHGAAGIGIARRYAWSITHDPVYLDQYNTSIQKCLEDINARREDYTLCSGYAGMVTLLIKDKTAINKIAGDAAELYKRTGTYNTFTPANSRDMGLLSGRSGIGYMLINILTKGKMNNVLAIQLPPSKNKHAGHYTTKTVKEILYEKYYPRTYALLSKSSSIDLIRNVYSYEKLLRGIWQQHKGYLCYYKMNDHLNKAAAQFNDEMLWTAVYVNAAHVRLVHTTFNPAEPSEGQGSFVVLVEMHSTGIRELCVGKLTTLMISNLNKALTANELINRIAEEVKTDKQLIAEKVLTQLKELVKSRMVVYRMQH